MATKYDIARGTQDFLSPDMVVRNHVERFIRATFEAYGFQQIQTPIFERFELLAARSGEEIRESMFTFVSDREEYALRPELTAPVCRLVASGKLSEFPFPYKLYYIGQCFRYCRPQAGRYREFTQAGLELMGSKDPLADAEVIAIATKTLTNLGIKQFKIKIGNIGIFRRILEQHYPDDYEQQSRVINNIDHIMSVREKCGAIVTHEDLLQEDLDYVRVETEALYHLQEQIGYSGEFEIFPEQELSGETIRQRLTKLPEVAEATYRSLWEMGNVVSKDTANLLINISRTRGEFKDVMPCAEELLASTHALEALNELSQVCNWLHKLGVFVFEVVLGVARGLDFYTGTVFEIDSPLLGAQKQVCGGGRYDKLVEEFGGNSLPATGFAFGFDRIVEVFKKSGNVVDFAPIDIFAANSDTGCKPQAVEVAETLRAGGLRTCSDLLGLDLREQLGYAAKVGAKFVVILGPEELKENNCKLRELSTRSEETVSLSSIVEKIKGRMASEEKLV